MGLSCALPKSIAWIGMGRTYPMDNKDFDSSRGGSKVIPLLLYVYDIV